VENMKHHYTTKQNTRIERERQHHGTHLSLLEYRRVDLEDGIAGKKDYKIFLFFCCVVSNFVQMVPEDESIGGRLDRSIAWLSRVTITFDLYRIFYLRCQYCTEVTEASKPT
jgi:hypothetical protein